MYRYWSCPPGRLDEDFSFGLSVAYIINKESFIVISFIVSVQRGLADPQSIHTILPLSLQTYSFRLTQKLKIVYDPS